MTAVELVVRWCPAAGDERAVARALLIRTAAACAGAPVGAVRLDRSPAGAPLLRGAAAGLHASVSHTTGLCAVAVSRLGPVGVDVEGVRPLPALGMSRRWFAPEDTEWLSGQPEERRVKAFLMLWTGKEAVGKCYGVGLRGGAGLRRRIAPPGPAGWQSTVDDPGVVVAHRELPGHLLAIASVPAVSRARHDLGAALPPPSSVAQGDPEPGPIASDAPGDDHDDHDDHDGDRRDDRDGGGDRQTRPSRAG